MKKETAMARVKSAAEKHNISKSSKAYKLIMEALKHNRKRIRPVYTTGSGRWVGLSDYFGLTDLLLDRAGIKHKNGNDAPRGGRTGAYIELTHIDNAPTVEVLVSYTGGRWSVEETHHEFNKTYKYYLIDTIQSRQSVMEWAKRQFDNEYYKVKFAK